MLAVRAGRGQIRRSIYLVSEIFVYNPFSLFAVRDRRTSLTVYAIAVACVPHPLSSLAIFAQESCLCTTVVVFARNICPGVMTIFSTGEGSVNTITEVTDISKEGRNDRTRLLSFTSRHAHPPFS